MVSPFVGGSGKSESSASNSKEFPAANRMISGFSFSILPLSEEQIFSYTVAPGKNSRIIGVSFSGNGPGRFRLEKNGTILFICRTSYFQRNVSFDLPLIMQESDVLQSFVKNDTITQDSNDYEAFLFVMEGFA